MTKPITGLNALLSAALWAAIAAHAPAQTFTPLAHIGNAYISPQGGFTQGLDGALYTTSQGREKNPRRFQGALIRMTTSGDLTFVNHLCCFAQASPILAANGNLYGTTQDGGLQHEAGSVFELTPSGNFSALYDFPCKKTTPVTCPDGSSLQAPLIQATDGNLYGTAALYGAGCEGTGGYGCGTVFKLTLAGKATDLHTFCTQAGCPDGAVPYGGLVQASDGNFYGTTVTGGAYQEGTIFRITPRGALTTLYSFCAQGGEPHCPDGSNPQAGLVQGSDGNLYGTTLYRTIFRITLDGALTTLYTFCDQTDCGSNPYAGLIQATDGSFYGTAQLGGAVGQGIVYAITPSGTFTVLHSFCSLPKCADGEYPFGPLFQATDGNLYGAASGPGGGVLYQLNMGLAPFAISVPNFGKAGAAITILGTNLTGATAVTFNGTPVSAFTVNSTGSAISTTVPAGATTGSIQVTLASGSTISSNLPFQVKK